MTEEDVAEARRKADERDRKRQGIQVVLNSDKKITVDYKNLVNCNPYCGCQYIGYCMENIDTSEYKEIEKLISEKAGVI